MVDDVQKLTKILLIRHAESEINAWEPPVIGGRSGWCELTERGIAQSRVLGRWLAERQIGCDRTISSTAVRAQQTARYCLSEVGLALRKIEVFTEIEELSQGEWENEPRSRIITPETKALMDAAHWNFRAPGGESQADLYARAHAWLQRAILPHPSRCVWVFCHGLVIKVLLAGLFDLDRRTAWRIPIDNTSMTTIAHREGRWQLLGQNESPHLSPSKT